MEFRNLLKLSIKTGLVEHLCQYETELRRLLELETTHTFELNLRLDEWRSQQHRWVYLVLQCVFTVALSGIPAFVLFVLDSRSHHAWAYVAICVTALLSLLGSTVLLRRFRLRGGASGTS
jgi:hypothetical protein